MSMRLNPYLHLGTRTAEAMEFYRGVFGGEYVLSHFTEFGVSEGPDADLVMHAQLETDAGFTIMAADTPSFMEGPSADASNITVSLSGTDAALRRYWDGLAEGGTVEMPLEKQMWGDEYGQLKDRYGISWMVNIGDGGGQAESADPTD